MATADATKVKGGSFGLSYPMLDRSNYTSWSLKMRVVMQAQGVWVAVEHIDPKAAVEDKLDKIALAMIYQGIPEDMLLSIAEKKTAMAAWDAIKTLYQGAEQVKKARVQTLKTEFEALNMKESDKLDDFYMKLNGLVTNIRALGEEVKESHVVKKLLRAVPARYLQITSTIEQFGNLDTMSVEKGNDNKLMLTEEEWRRRENSKGKLLLTREEWLQRSNKTGEGQSSGVRVRDKSRVRCVNCSAYGHFAYECKKPKNRNREQK